MTPTILLFQPPPHSHHLDRAPSTLNAHWRMSCSNLSLLRPSMDGRSSTRGWSQKGLWPPTSEWWIWCIIHTHTYTSLSCPRIKTDPLITHDFPLSQFEEVTDVQYGQSHYLYPQHHTHTHTHTHSNSRRHSGF